jgi:hypothetical protein
MIDSASLEMKDWGNLSYSGQSLILNLASSPLHWIVTCREKEKKDTKIVNGMTTSVSTGEFEPDSFSGILYNCKTVLRFWRDSDNPDTVMMTVEKDRTGTYATGQVVENPQITDFQPLIDSKVGADFTPRNTMEQAIAIEEKIYKKQAGITDDEVSSSEVKSASSYPDIDTLRKQIKSNHSKMNPDQRKSSSDKLKVENIPTSLSKIDDTGIMNRVLIISNEILEG